MEREEKKMRICFVSDQAFPYVGGEGVSTESFSLRLRKRGHRIFLFTSQVKHPPEISKIRIYRFSSLLIPKERGYLAFPSLDRICSALEKERIDVVQINLPSYFGWQTLRGARRLGIPVVLGFHAQVGNILGSILPPHSPFLFFPKKVMENWFSYFYQKGDLVITPSLFASQILRRYTHKPIGVVSNGIDLKKFNPSRASLGEQRQFRERYSLNNFPILLYVGRLSHEKNVGYLLRIGEGLKGRGIKVKLLIVGKGILRNKLEEEIARLGMEKEIVLTGYLREEEKIYAYLVSDIFLLPSLNELQSIASLEAMATKNVILVGRSEENAAQELIKEGVNGYTFSLQDPQDAVDKIHRILSHKDLRKFMQEQSSKMVLDHDIEKSVSKLEEIYQELINHGK